MVLTKDEALAEKMRSLRDHGASVSDLQRHHGKRSYLLPEYNRVGYNYRMTDFQGAVGVAQMGKLKHIMQQRSRLARNYDQALADLEWLKTPYMPANHVHGYQSYVCLYKPEELNMDNVGKLHHERNALMDKLEAQGIATRQGTQAVHILGYFACKYGLCASDFQNSFLADRLSLTLPLYPQMTEIEQAFVIEHLRQG